MRLAFEISYVGTGFHGSQQQADKRTVMGEIIKCLCDLGIFSSAYDAGMSVSGRTDAGVHAKRQIIAFNTEYPERAVSAVNKKLPPDIRFTGYAKVPPDFNPRFAAKKRTYRYYFPLGNGVISYDFDKMETLARLFEGRHDFSGFSRQNGKDPEREIISSKIWREGDFFLYEICGHSFLWHMVRCIAYTLDSVGRGVMDASDVSEALKNPSGKRFPAAPPEGLILWDVDCGIDFIPVDIHEKSILFTNDNLRYHSQLKKIYEIW
ncbi:MAG: tRNA pseudouridine(38-40) synthase TruA [Methanomicrobiaceae archaeon]|nr:tRNA pseudouridine(38-40) synthase TruA [Methanomicrobiaceae archaeon]